MKIEQNVMFWQIDNDFCGDYASIFKNQQVPILRILAITTYECIDLIVWIFYHALSRNSTKTKSK